MISNKMIKELGEYFAKKENPTEQEKEFLYGLALHADAFPITAVTRDDLEDRGYDVKKISDSDMDKLARKMGDDYCEQMFWESMDILAECLGFPKLGDA